MANVVDSDCAQSVRERRVRRSHARRAMDAAHTKLQQSHHDLDIVWSEFLCIVEARKKPMRQLEKDCAKLTRKVQEAFRKSHDAFHNWRRSEMAQSYAKDARTQNDLLRHATSQWQCLVDEVNAARNKHKAALQAYKQAKKKFSRAKRSYDRITAELAGVPAKYLDYVAVEAGVGKAAEIYFGGGGHYTLDARGVLIYARLPGHPRGAQNFTQSPAR